VCLGAAVIAHAAPPAAGVAVTWQHHHASFDYVGFTVAYNCDALEAQVARILKYLGARDDLKVVANCRRGADELAHHAWVNVDFDVPVESDEPDGAYGQWTAVVMNSRHPNFLGQGDCEIVESIKSLIVANFGLRNLDYQVSCAPHQLSSQDFSVKAEALKVTPRPPR